LRDWANKQPRYSTEYIIIHKTKARRNESVNVLCFDVFVSISGDCVRSLVIGKQNSIFGRIFCAKQGNANIANNNTFMDFIFKIIEQPQEISNKKLDIYIA
jgi:hypothetical protein